MPKAPKDKTSRVLSSGADPYSVLERPRFDTASSHDKWPPRAGYFKIMSLVNVQFFVPPYHLQSWSEVFRDTIEVGSGEASVELDSDSSTIEHFLSIIETASFSILPRKNMTFLAQVLALSDFLGRYGCTAAVEVFLHVVRQRVAAPKDWPPLTLFLVGIQLQRPKVCAEALTLKPRKWEECSGWKLPEGVNSALDTLDPVSFSYEIFRQIPSEHLWALSQARQFDPSKTKAKVAPDLPPMGPRDRFEHYFELCTVHHPPVKHPRWTVLTGLGVRR